MTTRQRLARLAPVLKSFPGLGCAGVRDLEKWLTLELGAVDSLDVWQKRGAGKTRAQAPQSIYHILAGNLGVSGQHSLLCGLLLGSHNTVKLPSHGGEEIEAFIKALPASLRGLVAWSRELDADALAHADAVIAYGSDDTIADIRRKTRWDQIFLGYGLRVSVIWLGAVTKVTPALVAAVAHDVCIYDQMGCLSPQSIFIEAGSATEKFCAALAQAMHAEIGRLPKVSRSAEDSGRIMETIDTAQALGHGVWPTTRPDVAAGAVILDPGEEFRFSCLHRVVRVHEVKAARLESALEKVRGKISTVGIHGALNPRVEAIFNELGVSRFCPVGRMQHPPVWWHHDGRPSISDLVRWVDFELA